MEKTFEQILIAERKKRGLSLREAGARIGICHTYLSALEKGRDPRTGTKLEPSQDVILKICRAYEIDLSRAIPLFSFHDRYELYEFIAHQINALKTTNPGQYRELSRIVNK